MIPKKKGAPAQATQEAPQPNKSTDNIAEVSQKGKSSRKKELKNAGGLAMGSKTNSLNIKIYEEQAEGGFDALKKRIKEIDPALYHAMMIVHDKDVKTSPEDIFVEAFKKAHAHILIKKPGSEKSKDRAQVSTMLNVLGINFSANEEGIVLWSNRGVERIKDLAESVMYLTHETDKAIADGKELYERNEIVSNLDDDVIDQFRDGYTSISHMKRRLTLEEQIELAEAAYNAGYALRNKVDWLQSLPLNVYKGSLRKTLEDKFDYGAKKYAEEHRDLVRLAVFIKGAPNIGKTYAAYHAFDDKGYKILTIDAGGGSGKFDNLTSSHNVIIADDTTIENALGMTDNIICQPYRRGSNNPFWTGQYIIITSNDDLDKWCKKCCNYDAEAIDALKTRLYVCEVIEEQGRSRMICTKPSTRGNKEQQETRKKMFVDFQNIYNNIIGGYSSTSADVDYSDIIEQQNGWFGSRYTTDKKQLHGQMQLPKVDDALPFG